jgi:hypothetical protein
MRIGMRAMVAVGMILAGGAVCSAADQIDNPQYTAWAKFKPGTSVTTKMVSDAAGQKTEMEITTTLVEVTAAKLVLEAKTSMSAGGQKMEMPAQKTDVAAKVDKPAAVAVAPDAPKGEVKESTDEVEVMGKKVKCKVMETKTTANGMNINSKTWTSDEIPGGMVKMETKMDGAMTGTTTVMATAYAIKI